MIHQELSYILLYYLFYAICSILFVISYYIISYYIILSFGMLLSKLSNRNTHVCTSSIRMISFFTLQCELFTSCNVSNNGSLVSAQTLGGGWVVNQMWADLDRGRGGVPGGSQVPKIPKFVWTSFMDDLFDGT